MLISRRSPVTGAINTMDIDITEEQIIKYEQGALIQYAFPNISASEREFILTGMTSEDWENTFPEDDDE